MRAVLIATLACTVTAASVFVTSEAQAQMGGPSTGYGKGYRRPGGEEGKSPNTCRVPRRRKRTSPSIPPGRR